MTFSDLMNDFCELAEIEPIVPRPGGAVRIDIDGVVVAFMERESGTLVTWAEVCDLPADGGDRLCRRLMAGSLLGIATGGAALTLDEESGKVMIHRDDPLDGLAPADFVRRLNAFLDERAKWAAFAEDKPDPQTVEFGPAHEFIPV